MNENGEGEIWGATGREWMGIIPRLKATTEDPISVEVESTALPGVHRQTMQPALSPALGHAMA